MTAPVVTLDGQINALLGLPSAELESVLLTLLETHDLGDVEAWTDGSRNQNRLVHRFAMMGHADALEILAGAGANLNAQRTADLCSPLHLASWHGQPFVFARLEALGADVDLANRFGETARVLATQREERCSCWHQQADLLLNVAPLILRRLLQERWAAYAGPDAELGPTLIRGSDDRIAVGGSANVRRGGGSVATAEDLRGIIAKGQHFWLQGIELEAAAEPTWSAPAGRWVGGGEIVVTSRWPASDVRNGQLEVQRLPPEVRMPPGSDAFKKVRSGRIDTWDLTLLAHFLGDDQCRTARNLVPDPAHRQLIRELKDVRNKAALHLGRAEVDPQDVHSTAQLLRSMCDSLVPGLSEDVSDMVDEIQGRMVVPEKVLHELELRIAEEHDRAELMEGQLQSAGRFRAHVPPGAFTMKDKSADADVSTDEGASEWSGVRSCSTLAAPGTVRVCGSIHELQAALVLPEHCRATVVQRCFELLVACPKCKNLLIVVRTAATATDEVLLDKVGSHEVQERWKDQRAAVEQIEPTFELFNDWCLPDGVLISGDKGRVLRVTAQFRPPRSEWNLKNPFLRRAVDIACAVESVVMLSYEGTVFATATAQTRRGEHFQLSTNLCCHSDDNDVASVFRGAETVTEADVGDGMSTAKKVANRFFPFMRGREQMTQALQLHASEQVRRWGDGSASISEENAALVAENASKWLWNIYQQCSTEEAEEALRVGEAVLERLEANDLEARVPQLLLPMAEIDRMLGRVQKALDTLNRARKLSGKHDDFESGFSAHQALFAHYMYYSRHTEARAVLIGGQRLLDKERELRQGPGMDEFMRSKQLFQSSNKARLDAKLALEQGTADSLQSAKALLEETIEGMMSMQGTSFVGNTSRNLAELLSLLSYLAMACHDAAGVRRALEQELPLRRAMQQEQKTGVVLVNLGRACLGLDDCTAAERYLSEAEAVHQGLLDASAAGSSSPAGATCTDGMMQAGMSDVQRLLARCAELRGDLDASVAHLERAVAVNPAVVGKSAEAKQLQDHLTRVMLLRQRVGPSIIGDTKESGPSTDKFVNGASSLDELAAFIESSPAKHAKPASRRHPQGACTASMKAHDMRGSERGAEELQGKLHDGKTMACHNPGECEGEVAGLKPKKKKARPKKKN